MTKYVAIYGAGELGGIFFDNISGQQRVDFFLDQYSPASEHRGVPVRRLESIEDPTVVRVYVAVINRPSKHERPEAGLAEMLARRGFDVVPFVDTLKSFGGILREYARKEHLWWRVDSDQMLDETAISTLRKRLADDKSRDQLDRIVQFRRTLDSADYPLPDDEVEYFPDDVPLFDQIDTVRFADCGAYTGDTVRDLLQWTPCPVDYVASFEPDPENLQKLQDVARQARAEHPDGQFLVFPAGCWSNNDILNFTAGNTSSSAVSDPSIAKASLVPAFSLDTVLGGAPPNFIKMDIEGAEQEALKGSHALIAKHRPVLAVCLYHRPADLWEIPEIIEQMAPGYRMYLRLHNHLGLSTVLYCCP